MLFTSINFPTPPSRIAMTPGGTFAFRQDGRMLHAHYLPLGGYDVTCYSVENPHDGPASLISVTDEAGFTGPSGAVFFRPDGFVRPDDFTIPVDRDNRFVLRIRTSPQLQYRQVVTLFSGCDWHPDYENNCRHRTVVQCYDQKVTAVQVVGVGPAGGGRWAMVLRYGQHGQRSRNLDLLTFPARGNFADTLHHGTRVTDLMLGRPVIHGKRLYVVQYDRLAMYDFETNRVYPTKVRSSVDPSVSADGQRIVVAHKSEVVELDFKLNIIKKYDFGRHVLGVAQSPDGTLVALLTIDGVLLYDAD